MGPRSTRSRTVLRRRRPARGTRSFREQHHLTSVAGTRVAWTEQGSGETLVLLHGIGDSRRTWRRVAPALARGYRVLTPDLPGHGLSGRPDAPYTLDWYARVVLAWLGRIGVRRTHVVGHSFGGGVAQWLLLDRRSPVDRLALIAAGGLGRAVGLGLRLAALPFPERFCPPLAMWLGTWLGLVLSRRTFGYPSIREIREIARLNAIRGTGRAFCRTVRGVIDLTGQYMQTRDGVGGISTLPPIALFWGAQDRIIPVDHGREALALLRGATLDVYPGCGHYPHLEQPEQLVAGILAFLGDPQRPLVQLARPDAATVLLFGRPPPCPSAAG
jgi:pimeloyl-ACP methyl ester carboxylesterase